MTSSSAQPSAATDRPGRHRESTSAPVTTALRCLLVTGVLLAVAGLAGHYLAWPLLTATLGPTAYVFAAHPGTETARFRNAVVGHGLAVGVGVGALAVFGLVHHPSVSALGAPTVKQVAAAALAAGVTVLLLEIVGYHHAPAAATAVLISTGLARPGRPLIGLVVGLAVVVALGPLLGRIGSRADPAGQQ
jgi:hypothetical protein